jgi:hypothetical protein
MRVGRMITSFNVHWQLPTTIYLLQEENIAFKVPHIPRNEWVTMIGRNTGFDSLQFLPETHQILHYLEGSLHEIM